MKVSEVPVGYVFFLVPMLDVSASSNESPQEGGIKFLKIKGQLNALNLTSYLPCKIYDNAEVGTRLPIIQDFHPPDAWAIEEAHEDCVAMPERRVRRLRRICRHNPL